MLNKKEEKTIKVRPETKNRLDKGRMDRSPIDMTIKLVNHVDDLSFIPAEVVNKLVKKYKK